MNVSEEMVRELQSRIDVSYEEAEYYIKRTKGNIDEAVEMIQRRRDSSTEKVRTGLSQLLHNLLQYRFIMSKKNEVYINIPILLIILFLLFFGKGNFFFMLVVLIIALAMEIEIRVKKKEDLTKTNWTKETKPSEEYKSSYQPEVIQGAEVKPKAEPSQGKEEEDSYEIIIEE